MRRFSQRNSLVTLSDINITPLLDLAFVLLIIFVITTPLLEKGLDLKLPSITGSAEKQPRKSDIRMVEVSPQGLYVLDRQRMSLEQVIREPGPDAPGQPEPGGGHPGRQRRARGVIDGPAGRLPAAGD